MARRARRVDHRDIADQRVSLTGNDFDGALINLEYAEAVILRGSMACTDEVRRCGPEATMK
jgi:hypothetical protein